MSVQRVDLLFQAASGYGWSESYYYYPGGLTTPNVKVLQLVADRRAILSQDCSINYIRIASGYIRSPYLYDAAYPATGSLVGTGGLDSGVDFVALLLRLQGTIPGVGRLFLRGIPEAEYSGDVYSPSEFYLDAMQQFTSDLMDGSSWAIYTSASTMALERYSVSALTPLSPRGYTFQSQIDLVLEVGNKIRMHQAIEVGYNGIKKIVNQSGTGPFTYSVGGAAPTAADSGTNHPFITIPAFQHTLIKTATPERISRRNTGRFFGQRRGRRSTVLALRR